MSLVNETGEGESLIIVATSGLYGPFRQVTTATDHYVADGLVLPFIVLGAPELKSVVLPPDFIPANYHYDEDTGNVVKNPDNTPPEVIAAQLAEAKAVLVKKIDSDTDQVYADVLGNRASEYTQAEIDANAYKTANYTGTVPASVQAWATAKGWTAKQAADDILAVAAAWRGAAANLRAARLLRKEQARNAADQDALATVEVQWNGFLSAIRSALNI